MSTQMSREAETRAFIDKIESLSGQNLLACYQCGKCSAGCPMAKHMDIPPNQMIRYVQLGLKKDLLASESIWMCVSCLTCNSRCPKGVRIAEIIESLRQMHLRVRNDFFDVRKLPSDVLGDLPPIALIGGMRKFTS
ncbi:MAG: 4Fe-4S dicluster domain-containing protein [Gammaproteobacteria bacterium]|nr:4Fe-4S dicluster domain-containing protein [Gammaproteobacteria bacterium]MBU1415072.1 4Fe-4S dicluster domain-containing protein [Gammaproteobacteria bacterium]